jgi:ribosomal protein L11 methyltransferase
MGYYEFSLTVAPEAADALIQLLVDSGCLGVYEDNHRIIAYFSDNLGINKIRHRVQTAISSVQEGGLAAQILSDYTYIAERDWNETWKKKFQPIDIGLNLTIIPPWYTDTRERISIIIDPGMAFGTGHHETTQCCVALIERLSLQSVRGRFCDIGTGTGILAIAARKLGFAEAVGVDIDPLAVDAAKRNILHNNLDYITIFEGSVEKVEGMFDFIAANLLSEILKSLAPMVISHMKPGSLALLSGMLNGQQQEVIDIYNALGTTVQEELVDGRWVSLLITRCR